jgi:AcrR family transcriptional regulator
MKTSTALRRRNATYYGGDLRRDLLDAALRVVAKEGPAAVNLRALARQLGVSHAAPANHFTDKTAIFTAIAQEGFELLGQAMDQAVAEVPADQPGRARIAATGQAYMRFALTHRAHFEVMWRSDLLRREDSALHAAADATFDQLIAGVRAAQADAWAAGADERSVAYLAWAAVHGLAVLWLNGPLPNLDERPFDEIASAVATLLNQALAAFAAPTTEGDSDA